MNSFYDGNGNEIVDKLTDIISDSDNMKQWKNSE